jgi:hypothetical protein
MGLMVGYALSKLSLPLFFWFCFITLSLRHGVLSFAFAIGNQLGPIEQGNAFLIWTVKQGFFLDQLVLMMYIGSQVAFLYKEYVA